MKYFKHSFATLLSACLIVNSGYAQNPQPYPGNSPDTAKVDTGMTIDQVLSEVIRNNPSLSAARSKERSISAQISQAGAWDDLQAGLELYSIPFGAENPLSENMETDYFLQQMIPFPGKKGAMADAAQANAKMAGQSILTIERTLIAGTKRAFAMLYSAQQRVQVNEENLGLLEQIISSARSKYSVGIGTLGDVLKVQVELARLQNERSVLDQEVSSAVAMINALRSRPSVTFIGKVAPMPLDSVSLTLDSLFHLAIGFRPELQAMSYEIEMNRAELSVSKKEWFPDFMLKGTYKQMKDQNDQWAAMIGINIPISPWGINRYSGKNEENEEKIKSSEQSFLNMQNMVQAEVRDAYAKAQSRWQQIGRYQSHILPQAEQSLNASLASYRIDKADFLSLLDSYRTLNMFRMEYFMTVGEYFSNFASLEQAVGKDLGGPQ